MRKERTSAIDHFKSKLLLLDNKTVWAFCKSIKSHFLKNIIIREKTTNKNINKSNKTIKTHCVRFSSILW